MDLHKIKNNSREKYLAFLFCAIIGFSTVSQALLLSLRSIIILPFKMDTILIYGLLFLIIFYTIPLILSKITLQDIALLLVFTIFWLMLYTENHDYFLIIGKQFILGVFPCYIVSKCISDYKLTSKYLCITAILITLSEFILLFVLHIGLSDSYSQYSGYQLLPAAVISANEFLRGRNKIHLGNFILSIFLIFAAGARGPLICVALFIGLKAVISVKKSIKNFLIVIVSSFLLLLCIKYYFTDILNYARQIMVQYNMSVRVIDRLLANEFLQDNNRISIANYAWQVIKENPILGVGLGKDRIIIATFLGMSSSEIAGCYPHNIVLELYMQFGLIIGSIIVIIIIFIFLKAIFGAKNKEEQDLACIFIASGAFPLLFSGSYLTSSLFFCAIAVCINICKSSKYNKLRNMAIGRDTNI